MPFEVPSDELDSNILSERWIAKLPQSIHNPKIFRQKLKIKSCCPNCKNKWTSMKGVSEFRIGKSRSGSTKYISCQIYQQKCKRCNIYVEPDYYTDEFMDLVNMIIQKFDNPQHSSYAIRKRNGNPKGGHINCEACELCITH